MLPNLRTVHTRNTNRQYITTVQLQIGEAIPVQIQQPKKYMIAKKQPTQRPLVQKVDLMEQYYKPKVQMYHSQPQQKSKSVTSMQYPVNVQPKNNIKQTQQQQRVKSVHMTLAQFEGTDSEGDVEYIEGEEIMY
ncbi:Hypothetical_protein [Hexamita inflata]|uniref:Hypothetical_protein n=1 Tax=Hexamita inflata TaxID=28002 RepID=A0AA86V6E4_9EUKA|nr:Hypothetical protein HINF_LOCUS65836 [Hexamita inflata]